MIGTLILMATLVVAICWTIYQQLLVNKQAETLEEMDEHIELLESVLTDVAKGEAHVWIEDGDVRAQKRATGEIQMH
jgi:hypothetical protein